MNASTVVGALALAFILSGCGAGASSQLSTSPATAIPMPSVATSAPVSPSTQAAATALIGSWHRPQTCTEMLVAFEAIGLARSHVGWLTGNFLGGSPGPSGGDVCAGAQGPLEHAHDFTATGGFASRDDHGKQVDGGDFVVVDADTVAFPSHAAEFDPGGQILVDYVVSGDVATFKVALPDVCDGACKDGYAWAASAFASGPWTRGDIP